MQDSFQCSIFNPFYNGCNSIKLELKMYLDCFRPLPNLSVQMPELRMMLILEYPPSLQENQQPLFPLKTLMKIA